MATLTNPGSRVDQLLTLARLSLPDAIRRGDQVPAVAMGLAFLYLVISTVSTLALLPALFGIEDDGLRRNILNLCACFVTLLWLLGQVVLRFPVSWLFDVEPLLRLPIGYRDLYLLRLALSLMGYWLVGLGPAAVYVLATQTNGPIHFVLAAAALLVLVLLLGRVAALLTLTVDRFTENLIGLIGLFIACIGVIYGVGVGIRILEGEAEIEAVADSIRNSSLLASAEFTPPGLVVAILDSPGVDEASIGRLGALLALLAAAILVERRLLLRQYLSRPGGDRRTASPVMPLARILRHRARLPPAVSLALVEVECAFRAKGVRWAYVICLAYASYSSIDLYLGILAAAFLATILLGSVSTEKPPQSCQVWRESLTLPQTVLQIFRAPARVRILLVLPVAAVATGVGLTDAGWSEWPLAAMALAIVAALLLLADGIYSLIQLYWPKRHIGAASKHEHENFTAGIVAPLPMFALLCLAIVLWRIREEAERGPVIAGILAVAILLVAALVRHAATARQERELKARSHELLLRDPDK